MNYKIERMNKISLLLVLISIGLNLKGQEFIHLQEINGIQQEPTPTVLMTERIKEAAIQYMQYAPVPRIALFDYAFGANLDEHIKLNGYGVLFITSLNQDKNEYPIKKIYINAIDTIVELTNIGFQNVPIRNKEIKKVFGKNRIDYYFLIPYEYTQLEGQLLIDWSKNRIEFISMSFPSELVLDFINPSDIILNTKNIDILFLEKFLKREFQIEYKK